MNEVTVEVKQVVAVEVTRGDGSEGNPFRVVSQYFDLDGKKLAEADPQSGVVPNQ